MFTWNKVSHTSTWWLMKYIRVLLPEVIVPLIWQYIVSWRVLEILASMSVSDEMWVAIDFYLYIGLWIAVVSVFVEAMMIFRGNLYLAINSGSDNVSEFCELSQKMHSRWTALSFSNKSTNASVIFK